jgi:hypothetical protein
MILTTVTAGKLTVTRLDPLPGAVADRAAVWLITGVSAEIMVLEAGHESV